MKVAVITCYFDPDYVRARTIRAALKNIPGVRPIIVKNTHKSWVRYIEIIWRLIELRRNAKPDVWLVTFRGQEILPLVLLLAGHKPVIFDEFIVPIAYARQEGHARSFATSTKHVLAELAQPFYEFWLRHCRVILADTPAHAELSAKSSHVNMRQYHVLPVGTDETLFQPTSMTKPQQITTPFRVFFYGNMLPLHGLPVVLEAAEQLKDQEAIEFLIVGGKKEVVSLIEQAVARGARIVYEPWIPFEDLPAAIHASALTLGGPFGGSTQAQNVVTGKTFQFLACASPVVVGESVTTETWFKDKQNALVVPQSDATSLAKAIQWGATHRSELVDIARNGQALYERAFSGKVITAELQKVLEQL